ncbi:hypothetical protein [Burkholderia cenocepacia]|uniref:hypothetical protein n=1 Tax=Burkholderia cenocepacia TaxID=95486 RepID=UPI001177A6A8|nr:hypothetical protein [Burkholderia cenocepacia]
MKSSDIKLITKSLEEKGYNIIKTTSSWSNKVVYIVSHPNGTRFDFAPSDDKTIQSLINEQKHLLGHLHNEQTKYQALLNEMKIDVSLFHHEYKKMTLPEIWDVVKTNYEKNIKGCIEQSQEVEIVINDLQEILEK